MADGTTNYEVQIRMQLRDEAATKVRTLSAELDKTTKKAKETESSLKSMYGAAAAAATYVGIERAYDALIGFNAQVQQTKTSLAATVMINFGGTFEDAKKSAAGLFEEFQRFAMVSPTTTQEVAQFGQSIASAAFGAGATMKQFVTMTEQAVIASRVFGIESHLAQVQLQEMLIGNVRKTERFAIAMLAAGHVTLEQFRAMDAAGRKNFILKVLTSPAMAAAAKDMAKGWAGVTTTLIDNLQIFFGAVGKPLFERISKEIEHWNKLIEENRHTLEGLAKEWGERLVTAFNVVKDTVSFVIDHRDAFVAIGAAFMAGKSGMFGEGGMLGTLIGANIQGASGQKLLGGLQTALTRGLGAGALAAYLGGNAYQAVGTGVLGALSALPGKLGAVGAAATIAAEGLLLLSGEVNKSIEKEADRQARLVTIQSRMDMLLGSGGMMNFKGGAADYRAIARSAMESGYLDAAGRVNMAKLRGDLQLAERRPEYMGEEERRNERLLRGGMTPAEAWQVMSRQIVSGFADQQRALDTIAAITIAGQTERMKLGARQLFVLDKHLTGIFLNTNGLGQMATNLFSPIADRFASWSDFWGGPGQAPRQVNVNIQHIEVVADDPDRFVFGVVEIARRALVTGTSRYTP